MRQFRIPSAFLIALTLLGAGSSASADVIYSQVGPNKLTVHVDIAGRRVYSPGGAVWSADEHSSGYPYTRKSPTAIYEERNRAFASEVARKQGALREQHGQPHPLAQLASDSPGLKVQLRRYIPKWDRSYDQRERAPKHVELEFRHTAGVLEISVPALSLGWRPVPDAHESVQQGGAFHTYHLEPNTNINHRAITLTMRSGSSAPRLQLDLVPEHGPGFRAEFQPQSELPQTQTWD